MATGAVVLKEQLSGDVAVDEPIAAVSGGSTQRQLTGECAHS